MNQNKEEIEEENIINEYEIDNNPINNDNLDINYDKNKYINYLKLYKDYKKRCEFYESSNESLKNDILKAKTEIKELTKKLKENNIIVENHNNHITTLSSIKLNNQYNPNDYIILCDKTYENLKWFLIKKKYSEEDEENKNNTYDNLIWVPKIDIFDLNDFNKYVNEEEGNNIEMLNLIKKLEQKENIISKLNYKIEKYEKQLELINTYNNIEQNLKNKNNNNINGILKKTISEDSIVNDNGYLLSIRKDSARSHNKTKSEENSIPLEKFNILLEKLNQTEERFAKLQKENIELKKYEKLYLNQNSNNNNPINMTSNLNGNLQENKKDEIINNNILNSNDLNQSNKTEESDYYKINIMN